MTSKRESSDSPDRPDRPELSEQEVNEYLQRNREFLLDNPDLVSVLIPPAKHSGDNVLDLQHFMLERLQEENRRLTGHWDQLIATSRSNMAGQTQIHAAILVALEADSLEALVHAVTADWPQILDVDTVTLGTEGDPAAFGGVPESGLRQLGPGLVDRLLGGERDVVLRTGGDELDEIFGPAAPLVQSDALVRLAIGSGMEDGFSPCLLAMGAREADKFHPGQGTELLVFLARVLERHLSTWLTRAS